MFLHQRRGEQCRKNPHLNGREERSIEAVRGRAGSLSSSTGSSSPPATSEPSVSPLHQPQAIMKKKSKVDFFSDRARWVFTLYGFTFLGAEVFSLLTVFMGFVGLRGRFWKVNFRAFESYLLADNVVSSAYGILVVKRVYGFASFCEKVLFKQISRFMNATAGMEDWTFYLDKVYFTLNMCHNACN